MPPKEGSEGIVCNSVPEGRELNEPISVGDGIWEREGMGGGICLTISTAESTPDRPDSRLDIRVISGGGGVGGASEGGCKPGIPETSVRFDILENEETEDSDEAFVSIPLGAAVEGS